MTVCGEIVFTTCNSIKLAAKSVRVQRACPCGGAEPAIRTSGASPSPSSIRLRGGCARGLRSSAASQPAATTHWRMLKTVRALQPSASAADASLQLDPPASSVSKTFACWIFWAAALPLPITSVSASRSAAVSHTAYLTRGSLS